MTRDGMSQLREALVQAVIDSETNADGPALSEEFWELLKAEGIDQEILDEAYRRIRS